MEYLVQSKVALPSKILTPVEIGDQPEIQSQLSQFYCMQVSWSLKISDLQI